MTTLDYLADRFGVNLSQRSQPIEIPNTNRVTLAQMFYALGFTQGTEVGVEQGVYSEVLLQYNLTLNLTCVDAWQAYGGYRDHVSQSKLDRFFLATAERLSPFSARVRLDRRFSAEAAKDVKDGSLDFVYIDANHRLESVIADLAAWAPKVRPGGIVAGHDYLKAKLPSLMQVPQAIHAWVDAYEIRPLFVMGRHAKVEGELRDDGRSWFYVQPEPKAYPKGKIKQ